MEKAEVLEYEPFMSHVWPWTEYNSYMILIIILIKKKTKNCLFALLAMDYVMHSKGFELFNFLFLKLALESDIFFFCWWQLLLGYLPYDREFWMQELAKKRSQYKAFKEEFLMNPVGLLQYSVFRFTIWLLKL